MTCIKTGAHIYLLERNEWVVGDAFRVDGVYIFRLNNHRSQEPLRSVKHFTIYSYDHCFPGDWETMVAVAVAYHGYEGIPNEDNLL